MAKKWWLVLACVVAVLLGLFLRSTSPRDDKIIADLESIGWSFKYSAHPTPRLVDRILGRSLASRIIGEGKREIYHARYLDLWGRGGEPDLAGMPIWEGLWAIQIIDGEITAQTLAHLERFVGLRSLRFQDCRLTGGSIKSVGKLRKLRFLTLEITNVTDSDLVEVAKLSKLRNLGLDRANITDTGLARLTALRKLESLWIRKTAVSAEGVSHFKKMAPWCKRVVWDEDDSGYAQ